MTPEQQRIAIAEACGWKECPRCEDPECAYNVPPDYLNDLNAMHKAEKVLTEEQRSDMMLSLFKISTENGLSYPHIILTRELWCIAHATAAQRTKAFLRTLNLWTD